MTSDKPRAPELFEVIPLDMNYFVKQELSAKEKMRSSSVLNEENLPSLQATLKQVSDTYAPYWINQPQPLFVGVQDASGVSSLYLLPESQNHLVLLLEFMSPLSSYSLKSLEYLKILYQRYKSLGLLPILIIEDVSFLSTLNSVEIQTIKEWAMTQGIDFPLYFDHDLGVSKALENRIIPRRLLITQNQSILFDQKGLGQEEELETALQEAFRSLRPGLSFEKNLIPSLKSPKYENLNPVSEVPSQGLSEYSWTSSEELTSLSISLFSQQTLQIEISVDGDRFSSGQQGAQLIALGQKKYGLKFQYFFCGEILKNLPAQTKINIVSTESHRQFQILRIEGAKKLA